MQEQDRKMFIFNGNRTSLVFYLFLLALYKIVHLIFNKIGQKRENPSKTVLCSAIKVEIKIKQS